MCAILSQPFYHSSTPVNFKTNSRANLHFYITWFSLLVLFLINHLKVTDTTKMYIIMLCLRVAMPDALWDALRGLYDQLGVFSATDLWSVMRQYRGHFHAVIISMRTSVEVHHRHLHLYIKLNWQHRGQANESYFIGCTLAHWLWMLNEYQMSVKGQRKRLQLVNTQLLWMSHNKNNYYSGIINILCSLQLIHETQTE